MENIVLKIKKLLALSKSSNENEAKSSLLMAQKLLMKHKLTMKEINEYKETSIKELKTDITYKKAKWKGKLAKVIANNYKCYVYSEVNYSNQIMFFGREEDTTICKIVLEYAIDSINSKVKLLQKEAKKNYMSVKGIENDYALGFISGLEKAFEEQKRKYKDEWSLVVLKDKEVVEEYENFSKGFKTYPIKYVVENGKHFNEGVKDGKNFDITTRVGEDNENIKKALR